MTEIGRLKRKTQTLQSKLEAARSRELQRKQQAREFEKLLAGKATLYTSRVHRGVRVCVSHSPESVEAIARLVEDFHPELIVELGTKYGGLTLVLHEACPSALLFSYDATIAFRTVRPEWVLPNVHFEEANLLQGKNRELHSLLRQPRCKILYCDDGDKEREIELYSPDLQPGDLLGVHDWGKEINPERVASFLQGFERYRWEDFELENVTTRFWRRL